MTYDLLTIREMCDHFDVSLRTLRFYESKELLFPKREGKHRLFTRSCRVRMKLILQGKRFGFELEEIRRLLDLYDKEDGRKTQIAEAYSAAKIHFEAMCARKTELDQAIEELQVEIGKVGQWIEAAQNGGQHTGGMARA